MRATGPLPLGQEYFSGCFQTGGQIPLQHLSVFFIPACAHGSPICSVIWLPRCCGAGDGGGRGVGCRMEVWKDPSMVM